MDEMILFVFVSKEYLIEEEEGGEKEKKRKSKSLTRVNHSFFCSLALWGKQYFVGYAT